VSPAAHPASVGDASAPVRSGPRRLANAVNFRRSSTNRKIGKVRPQLTGTVNGPVREGADGVEHRRASARSEGGADERVARRPSVAERELDRLEKFNAGDPRFVGCCFGHLMPSVDSYDSNVTVEYQAAARNNASTEGAVIGVPDDHVRVWWLVMVAGDATELLVWGALVHLVVDWLFQNEWIAYNKVNLAHPAGYVHAAIHGLALLLVFPAAAALALAVAHLLIDTRRPLQWWAKVISQPQEGDVALTLHIFRDQALHLATIGAAALIVA
jgi:hypothetical protein